MYSKKKQNKIPAKLKIETTEPMTIDVADGCDDISISIGDGRVVRHGAVGLLGKKKSLQGYVKAGASRLKSIQEIYFFSIQHQTFEHSKTYSTGAENEVMTSSQLFTSCNG